MQTNIPDPQSAVPTDLDQTMSALRAIRNRQACRRDPSALRTMYDVCGQEQKSPIVQAKASPVAQGARMKPGLLVPGM